MQTIDWVGIGVVLLGCLLVATRRRHEALYRRLEEEYGPQPHTGMTSASGIGGVGFFVIVVGLLTVFVI